MKKVDMTALQIYLLSEVQHIDKNIALDWLQNTVATVSHDVDTNENVKSAEDRNQKIENMVRWHINNLNGFGGFEISVLHTEFKGGFYPFEASAASIVSDKLGINSPEPFGGNAELKEIMMPVAEKKFLQIMPANLGLKEYSDGKRGLYNFLSGDKNGHPWMKGGRFNLYIDNNKETWLVDFKFPDNHKTVIDCYQSPPEYHRASIALHKAQFEMAGLKIDHTCIVPFSMKEMKPYVAEVQIDSLLMQEVIDAGDQYWNNVVDNILPQRPIEKNFELISEVPPELRRLITKYIADKKTESLGKNAAAKLKDRILELCSANGIDWDVEDKKTSVPGLNITKKSKLYENVSMLKDDLRSLGGNPDDEKYKTVRMSTTMSVVRGKKGASAEFVNDVNDIILEVYNGAQEDLNALAKVESSQAVMKDPSEAIFSGNESDFDDFDDLDDDNDFCM